MVRQPGHDRLQEAVAGVGDRAAGSNASTATVPAISSGGKTPMTKKSFGRTASAAATQTSTNATSNSTVTPLNTSRSRTTTSRTRAPAALATRRPG